MSVAHCIEGSEGQALYGEIQALKRDSDICFIKSSFGSGSMYEFFKKEMRHPEGVEIEPGNSRVIIRFIVEKDGRLTHFEVIHSPDEKLSEEALRLMKLMPRWTPAKNKGKVVRCLFTIPVPFGIKQ